MVSYRREGNIFPLTKFNELIGSNGNLIKDDVHFYIKSIKI